MSTTRAGAPALLLVGALAGVLVVAGCGAGSDEGAEGDDAGRYAAPTTSLCADLALATTLAPVDAALTWTVTAPLVTGGGDDTSVLCGATGTSGTAGAAAGAPADAPGAAAAPVPQVAQVSLSLTVRRADPARVRELYSQETAQAPAAAGARPETEALAGWWTLGQRLEVAPAGGTVLLRDVARDADLLVEVIVNDLPASGAPPATEGDTAARTLRAEALSGAVLDALPRHLARS